MLLRVVVAIIKVLAPLWRPIEGPLLFVFALVVVVLAVLGLVIVKLTPSFADITVPPVSCPEHRTIIRIFGTHSTGEFEPAVGDEVTALDPANPPSSVFRRETRNRGFDSLLGAFGRCRVLTFSYDDKYLTPPGGTSNRGVHAWNLATSPWDRQPDELATFLQSLLKDEYDRDPAVTFDVIGYSAGGIVPTYWAARDVTTDLWRARIHSIIVVDGVVSGFTAFDTATCEQELWPIRIFEWLQFGRVPCQFASDSKYVQQVTHASWWSSIPFATVRARGDLIVWYDVAGIDPGPNGKKTVADPPIAVPTCGIAEFERDGLGCANPIWTHGFVLYSDVANRTVTGLISDPTRSPAGSRP